MNKVWIVLLCLAASAATVKAQDSKPISPYQAPPPRQPASLVNSVPTPPPAQQTPPDPDGGKFKFKEETHDFGEVMEGPQAECNFEFKNVGKKPIVITEAHGSCGCTVPSWPKEPILPKHKAVIHVTYNTQGRVGMINKDVIITSNAQQSPMKLHITGTVKPKPAAEGQPAPAPPPPPPAPAK